MRPPRGRGGFRGGRDGGGRGGGFRGGGRGGGGGRFGDRGGFRDEGPPSEVVEISSFLHACEGEAVTKLTNEKIPYFNAPIYLQNKTQIGKVDEIFGPVNESYFSIKMSEGIVATSYASGDKFYIDPAKLLPLARFLPQPKDRQQEVVVGVEEEDAVGVDAVGDFVEEVHHVAAAAEVPQEVVVVVALEVVVGDSRILCSFLIVLSTFISFFMMLFELQGMTMVVLLYFYHIMVVDYTF